jgi:hypothetical protein
MYEALGADGKRQHTVAEIAEAVSVHRTTIYEYLKAGKGISAADDQAGASGAAASLRPPSRGLPAEFRRQPLPHPAQGGRRIRPEFPAIRGDPICRPPGAAQDSVPEVRSKSHPAMLAPLKSAPVNSAACRSALLKIASRRGGDAHRPCRPARGSDGRTSGESSRNCSAYVRQRGERRRVLPQCHFHWRVRLIGARIPSHLDLDHARLICL